jgi:hypothetical protein
MDEPRAELYGSIRVLALLAKRVFAYQGIVADRVGIIGFE